MLLTMLLACCLLATSAQGQSSCDAPSQLAGVDEYCESLPAPGGPAGSDPRDSPAGVGPAVAVRSREQGADGRTVERLGGARERGTTQRADAADGAASSSAVASVAVGSAGGSPGAGLVAVLAAVALSVIGAAVAQRRRRAQRAAGPRP